MLANYRFSRVDVLPLSRTTDSAEIQIQMSPLGRNPSDVTLGFFTYGQPEQGFVISLKPEQGEVWEIGPRKRLIGELPGPVGICQDLEIDFRIERFLSNLIPRCQINGDTYHLSSDFIPGVKALEVMIGFEPTGDGQSWEYQLVPKTPDSRRDSIFSRLFEQRKTG